MNWIYTKRIEEILSQHQDASSWKDVILEIQYFAKEKGSIFKKLFSYTGQNSLTELIIDYGYRYISSVVLPVIGADKLPAELDRSARFYVYGTTYTMRNWVLTGMRESPEEISSCMSENIPEPIRKYFS